MVYLARVQLSQKLYQASSKQSDHLSHIACKHVLSKMVIGNYSLIGAKAAPCKMSAVHNTSSSLENYSIHGNLSHGIFRRLERRMDYHKERYLLAFCTADMHHGGVSCSGHYAYKGFSKRKKSSKLSRQSLSFSHRENFEIQVKYVR